MKVNYSAAALVVCLAAVCRPAAGQANINEAQETASVYVDGSTGSDANPGTKALPFKTIGKAAAAANANNTHSIGTHVWIAPGTYRESVALSGSAKSTALPVTFEATTPGTVIVSGADAWTGWQPVANRPGVYSQAWPYKWGVCPSATTGPFEQDIVLRREEISVNGKPLTQVLTLNQVGIGSFFVDETNGVVYIYPAPSTNITTAGVAVSTRPSLFVAVNRSGIVLRGLTFQKGNPCRNNEQVSFRSSSNILVDNSSFNWSNSGGLGFSGSSQFTVQNSFAMHNGQAGFRAFESKFGLWTANEADYSNWRGAQGGIYGWGGGGFHFFAEHNNTVNGAKMLFNMTHGVHWDTDDENITADNLTAANNLRIGVAVEKSQGPLSISNSHICRNALLGLYSDGGLSLRTSTFVNLSGNVVSNNTTSQVLVIGIQGGVPIAVTNYETGQNYNLLTTNLTMSSNTIMGGAGQQLFYDFDQAGEAWTNFLGTFSSDHNTWWSGSVALPFTEPAPSYFTSLSWPDWRKTTGQDLNSVFQAPAVDPTGPCHVNAEAPDFWFVNQDQGALTVTHGSAAVYTLLVIPVGGFNARTTFSRNGVSLIPGATASWSQPSLPGSGAVHFTVNTSASTPPGRYPLTLAAHNGNTEHTVTVSLIVQ
jgi:hypothetical protein